MLERPALPAAAPQWFVAHVPAAAGSGVRLPHLRLHGGGAGHGIVCACVYVYVVLCSVRRASRWMRLLECFWNEHRLLQT